MSKRSLQIIQMYRGMHLLCAWYKQIYIIRPSYDVQKYISSSALLICYTISCKHSYLKYAESILCWERLAKDNSQEKSQNKILTAFFRSSTLTFSRPSRAAKLLATRAAYSSARCPCKILKGWRLILLVTFRSRLD